MVKRGREDAAVKIKEAAERLGISQRAIRFYERQGLLKPSDRRTIGTGNSARTTSGGCRRSSRRPD